MFPSVLLLNGSGITKSINVTHPEPFGERGEQFYFEMSSHIQLPIVCLTAHFMVSLF